MPFLSNGNRSISCKDSDEFRHEEYEKDVAFADEKDERKIHEDSKCQDSPVLQVIDDCFHVGLFLKLSNEEIPEIQNGFSGYERPSVNADMVDEVSALHSISDGVPVYTEESRSI